MTNMTIILWIFLFIFYSFHAYINWRNNNQAGAWFYYAWLISVIPVFPLVTKYSKNLLFDGMLFDLVMFVSYVLTLLLLGSGKAFTLVQWLGLSLTVIGFILLKVKI